MAGGERAGGDRTRYTRVAVWLHWIIAALVLYNITGAIAAARLPEDMAGMFMTGHKANGILILFLSLARLGWRLSHRPPPLPPMPPWQAGAAHALHGLFYILIIAMPFSGWWFSSAANERWPLTFLRPVPSSLFACAARPAMERPAPSVPCRGRLHHGGAGSAAHRGSHEAPFHRPGPHADAYRAAAESTLTIGRSPLKISSG